jgi:hypothetical protein
VDEDGRVVSAAAAAALDELRAHPLSPPLEVFLAQCDEMREAFLDLVDTLRSRETLIEDSRLAIAT